MKPLLFSLDCNENLSKEVSNILGLPLSKDNIIRFADGEVFAKSKEDAEGRDCYIIHSLSTPVNDRLMELLIFVDSLRRYGAKKIVVIIPYFGYSRQDRAFKKGDPVSGILIHNLLKAVKIDEICCVDFHSMKLYEQYDLKKTNLTAINLLAKKVKERIKEIHEENNVCVISPDAGGLERAKLFASHFENSTFADVKKTRPSVNQVKLEEMHGDVDGKTCIIVDDLIDTGGTLIEVCEYVKEKGAKNIFIAATHGILSGNAIEKLNKLNINEIFLTNTIESNIIQNLNKCSVVSVASIIAEFLKPRFRKDDNEI